MEERVSGKASKYLYPPPSSMLTSLSFGEIIMDGASTFFRVLKCMRGQTSARQKTDVLWNNLQLSQHSKCVLFFTEKHM